MLNRTVACLMAVMILSVLIGCSPKNQGIDANPGDHSASGFTLSVLDDTYFNGSSAGKYTLSVDEYDEEVVVNINVEGAVDLKALFAQLSYDANTYRPMTGEPSTAMGEHDDLLVLNVLSETGVVHYNQILKNPDWRTGMTGNGLLAQVSFKKAPALDLRTVSTPPDSSDSATVLSWDDPTDTLSWAYYSIGDYDQNSEVGAADLVPIAQNFGENNTPNQFDVATIESVIDGDHNTEIAAADMVPIAQNFGNSSLGGYNIYHSTDAADYPDGGTLLENEPLANADNAANISSERLQFTYVVAAPAAGDKYWVRPTDGTNDGTASNIAGDTSDLPFITLVTAANGGDGLSSTTAYEMDATTDYTFTLTDPAGPTDVSVDANTTWTVNPAAAGAVVKGANAVLEIPDAFEGSFTVSATYNAIAAASAVFCKVDGGGGGDEIVIDAETGDADWGTATGTGTELDPYVLDDSSITTAEYGLEVTVGGTAADNADFLWSAFPPFIVTWASGVPPFIGNQFTVGYVFAQDESTNNSNNLYVEVHTLPST